MFLNCGRARNGRNWARGCAKPSAPAGAGSEAMRLGSSFAAGRCSPAAWTPSPAGSAPPSPTETHWTATPKLHNARVRAGTGPFPQMVGCRVCMRGVATHSTRPRKRPIGNGSTAGSGNPGYELLHQGKAARKQAGQSASKAGARGTGVVCLPRRAGQNSFARRTRVHARALCLFCSMLGTARGARKQSGCPRRGGGGGGGVGQGHAPLCCTRCGRSGARL